MRSIRLTAFAIAVACFMAVVPRVMACGHCIEDKIAATYDYAVMAAAQRHGNVVAFTEILGPVSPDAKLETWIRRSVESCAGVIAGTTRVSLAPAALSLAYDPRRISSGSLVRRINLRLSARGLRVGLLDSHLVAAQLSGGKRSPVPN